MLCEYTDGALNAGEKRDGNGDVGSGAIGRWEATNGERPGEGTGELMYGRSDGDGSGAVTYGEWWSAGEANGEPNEVTRGVSARAFGRLGAGMGVDGAEP